MIADRVHGVGLVKLPLGHDALRAGAEIGLQPMRIRTSLSQETAPPPLGEFVAAE
jgi:hypothetical protein